MERARGSMLICLQKGTHESGGNEIEFTTFVVEIY